MDKLLEISPGDILASGIFPGLKGREPILWANGENIIFDQGKVRKANGLVGLVDAPVQFTGIEPAQLLAGRVLYLGGLGQYGRYRSSDGYTTLKSGLSAGGTYVFAPYGEHLVVSNGTTDGLRYYDGADTQIATPFTYCQSIFPFRQQVFAIATSNGLNWIEWCDIDNAKTGWTPTLFNAAGNLQPRDLDGGFMAAHPLGGDLIALYTSGSLGHFTYVGGTLQYGYKTKVPGAGADSHYAVVPLANVHYGECQGRFYVTDGVTFDYIDDPAVRSYIEENFNRSRASEVFGWHDAANSTIRWNMPTGASDFIGVGYRYDTYRWTKFNDGVIVGAGPGVWDYNMLAKATRLVRSDPLTSTNDSIAFSSYIQTKPLDCGEREVYKNIEKVVLDLETDGAVSLYVGFCDDPNDTPIFNAAIAAVDGDNWLPRDEGTNREGLNVVIKLVSSALWKLGGFSIHGVGGGLKN